MEEIQGPMALETGAGAGERSQLGSAPQRRGTALSREKAMAYGHAERNLAAIRQLEAETRESLSGLPQLDLEQLQWLEETAEARLEPAPRVPARPGQLHLSA
jgi:hypothetical protein